MRKLLVRCAEVEKTAFQIYTALASYDYPSELVTIWQEMARDEESHQRQIEFAIRLMAEKALTEIEVSEVKVEAMYSEALSFYSLVREKKIPELSAVTLAMDTEKRFASAHILLAAKFKEPRLKEMFQFLGRADQAHLGALAEYKAVLDSRT